MHNSSPDVIYTSDTVAQNKIDLLVTVQIFVQTNGGVK